MSMRNIGIVYRKELTEALRDRRTLITTFLVPLLLIPVLGAGFTGVMSAVIGNAKKEKPRIMIIGGEDSPGVVEALRNNPKINVVPTSEDWKDLVVGKKIRAAVEIPPSFQADLSKGQAKTVKINVYGGELKSEFAAANIESLLKEYRDSVATERLTANHLPAELLKPFDVKRQNIAPPEKEAGAILGGIIAYMLILMCLNGAMHPAIDLTAGEKERGTMETILSSPVSRTHLVLGKFLLVMTASLITAVLLMVSVSVSSAVLQKSGALNQMVDEGEPVPQLSLGPAAVASVIIMAVPLSVLFSAGLFTIALFAKSHKEAQSYIAPLMFLVVIPAVSAMLPGVELTPKLAIVPLLNVSLLCKELVTGEYHWNFIILIFLSTCVYAAGALYLAVKMFQRESVLFRS
ncbi:MAG TPA: ABC transporter permease [Candidatus Acidoferrum sp.]|nr:ABC transporter permease [Candidatus Acidoferrum sp.]